MTLTIACCQFAPEGGAVRRTTDRMRGMAADAARAGAAVAVFPELCLCGYPSAAEAPTRAVRADSAEIEAVQDIARQTGLAVAFGFAERLPQGGLGNSMAFITADGALASVYRKVHLWVTEKEWAVPGDSFLPFDFMGQRIGMWICYDSRFPEAARTLARAGATAALVGSAWFGPAEEWELALRARAMDNGMFVAGAALLGAFGTAPFHGESLVVDPHGTVLARARPGREEIILAACDMSAVDACRARLPLLHDLQPRAYG